MQRRNTSQTHGFTLVELLVCMAVLAILASQALPGWHTLQERHRITSTRELLFNDLQTARIRALQRGERLQLKRLVDCSWVSSTGSDWSCGWQLVISSSQTALHTTQLPTPLRVTFTKTMPLDISARGDLGTVGEHWVVQSRENTSLTAEVLCLNSASRLRWQPGQACSS